MLVFIVMVLVFEGLINHYLLRQNPTTSNWFAQHPYHMALYGSAAAGFFEEGGRWLAFRLFLKKFRKWKDGMAYGIGHGGTEAVIVGTLASVQTFILAVLINSGQFSSLLPSAGPGAEVLHEVKQQLVAAPATFFALGGVERLFAFVLQLALSLLVLYSVSRKKPLYLFYAFLLHAGVNFVAAGLYQIGVLHLYVAEGIMAVVAVFSLFFIHKSKVWFSR